MPLTPPNPPQTPKALLVAPSRGKGLRLELSVTVNPHRPQRLVCRFPRLRPPSLPLALQVPFFVLAIKGEEGQDVGAELIKRYHSTAVDFIGGIENQFRNAFLRGCFPPLVPVRVDSRVEGLLRIPTG